MIVCLCNDVRECDIKKMVADGARSVRDVQSQSMAGTSCGACIFAIKKCLESQCESTVKLEESEISGIKGKSA